MKSLLLSVFLLSCTAFSQKYMILHNGANKSFIDTRNIDSITFVDSTAPVRGTILYSRPLYYRVDEFNTLAIGAGAGNGFGRTSGGIAHHAAATVTFADIVTDEGVLNSVKLTDIHNASAQNLDIKNGDTLFVSATINGIGGSPETIKARVIVIENPAMAGRIGASAIDYKVATLAQLLIVIEDFLTGTAWNGGGGSNASGVAFAIMPEGTVRIINGAGSTEALKNLSFSSSNSLSRSKVASAFFFNSTIATGTYSDTPNKLLRPVRVDDFFFNPLRYAATGSPLPGENAIPMIFLYDGMESDLQDEDSIKIVGTVGSAKDSATITIKRGINMGTSTTIQEFCDSIQSALTLPEFDGTPQNNSSVSIAQGPAIPILPGSFVIRGQPDKAKSISFLTINAKSTTAEARVLFNQNMLMTEF